MSRAWLVAVMWLLMYAVATAVVADSDVGRRILGQFVYDVPALLAAVLVARAWHRIRDGFWLLATLATGLLALGDVVYTAYPYLGGTLDPFPSWADAAYLGGGLTLLAALLIGFTQAAGLRWLKAALDGGLITLGVAAIVWPALAPAATEAPPSVQLLAVGYPMLVVGACVFWASVGVAGHRRLPPAVKLVGAALAVKAVSSLGFAYSEVQVDGYTGGGWLDLVFQLSPVLLCIAASCAAPTSKVEPLRLDRELGLFALGAGAVPALAVCGWHAWDGRVARPVLGLVFAVFILLGARMLVSLADARRVGRELDAALAEQGQLAAQDQLTTLYNRRFFDQAWQRASRRAVTDQGDLALLVLDLDHFKTINDSHGHPAGDEVLRQAAGRLAALVRPTDTLARYGGEEFVILAPMLSGASLRRTSERLCEAMRSAPFILPDGTAVAMTISIGAASFPHDAPEPAGLMHVADRALYEAKARGRDQAVVAHTAPEVPPELCADEGSDAKSLSGAGVQRLRGS